MNIFASAHGKCNQARGVYKTIIASSILRYEGLAVWAIRTSLAAKTTSEIYDAYRTDTIPELIGSHTATKAIQTTTKPYIQAKFVEALEYQPNRNIKSRPITANNVKAGRVEDLTKFKSRVDRMVVILHNADKAGLHIDIHIGNLSIVKRLPDGVKISRNAKGELTQASKDKVMAIVKEEFQNRARLAQNLDHSYTDAKYQWKVRSKGPTEYGAGEYRLIVDDSPIYLYSGEHALHVSAPHIVNNKLLYVYRLGTTEQNKVPILSVGVKEHDSSGLPDKLHLGLSTRKEDFLNKVGKDGDIRVKYDGGSTHISITKHGTALFSPRTSIKDGKRIEYNAKVIGVEKTQRVDEPILAMGELLYKDSKGNYLKAHEIGGILNGGVLPINIKPEIRIYRISKLNGKNYEFKSQEQHIEDIKSITKLNPTLFKVPEKVAYNKLSTYKNVEGFVGVPKGATIEDGIKLKERHNHADWTVESIDFTKGPSGRIAGIMWFKSLESGQRFKMGASSFGSDEKVQELLKNKRDYIGRVAKIASFQGHEGRASRFVEWHMDK